MNRLSPAEPAVPFTSALLLVRHEDLAVVDRRALREAGIRSVRVLSSGVEAARILHTAATESAKLEMTFRDDPNLVLCHEQLADMTGDEFVRLIRLHPLLMPFPILMAVASDTTAIRAKATESGYSGLLTRPYPQTALLTQLLRAAACRDATRAALCESTNTDTSAFDAALAYFISQDAAHSQDADKVYRSGLLAARQQQWDEAITTLQRASRLDTESGKILLALAAVWRGKGNADKSSAMLQEAVALFVKNRDWAQAVSVSQRLLREHPGMPHPLLGEARRLVASGNTHDAAEVLLCDDFAPDRTKNGLYEQIFRGCRATADPEQAVAALCACLATAGNAQLGKALQAFVCERLTHDEPSNTENPSVSSLTDTPGIELAPMTSGRSFALELAPERKATPDCFDLTEQDSSLAAPLSLANADPDRKQTATSARNNKKALAPDSNARKQRLATPRAIALLPEPSTPSALKRFPRLSDALAVAKVTLGLFKATKE